MGFIKTLARARTRFVQPGYELGPRARIAPLRRVFRYELRIVRFDSLACADADPPGVMKYKDSASVA
jgi:hypothetical protein